MWLSGALASLQARRGREGRCRGLLPCAQCSRAGDASFSLQAPVACLSFSKKSTRQESLWEGLNPSLLDMVTRVHRVLHHCGSYATMQLYSAQIEFINWNIETAPLSTKKDAFSGLVDPCKVMFTFSIAWQKLCVSMRIQQKCWMCFLPHKTFANLILKIF